jgi:hypothetical protein
MNYARLLTCSNWVMMISFGMFMVSLVFAFIIPIQSMTITVASHLANIVLATTIKFSYIVRLIAQKELGLQLR